MILGSLLKKLRPFKRKLIVCVWDKTIPMNIVAIARDGQRVDIDVSSTRGL